MYDQACSMHPPHVECYAVQVFFVVSGFDPKLMPKENNQITKKKKFASPKITIRVTAKIARNNINKLLNRPLNGNKIDLESHNSFLLFP